MKAKNFQRDANARCFFGILARRDDSIFEGWNGPAVVPQEYGT